MMLKNLKNSLRGRIFGCDNSKRKNSHEIPFHNFSTTLGKQFKNKFYTDVLDVIKDIKDGSILMFGGNLLCGIPENLIAALAKHPAKNYTAVCGTAGADNYGLGLLIQQRKIKRVISAYVGDDKELNKQFLAGELEVELTPGGNIVERIRAGGAGIPAFYSRTGFGTLIHEGGTPIKYNKDGQVELKSAPRKDRIFNGKTYLLEEAIKGDFAIIKAWKADPAGNLVFRKTAQNINSTMAKAAKTTIVEVEEMVELGEIPPDEVHIPGIFVDRIIKGEIYEKTILRLTTKRDENFVQPKDTMRFENRERIAKRTVLEFKNGMYISLGHGIPMLTTNYIKDNESFVLQSDNGILGIGPPPSIECVDPDLVNAVSETVTLVPGGYFSNVDESYGMIRGGYLDATVLGAFEVSRCGDMANWTIPGKFALGMGGAMDLVSAPGIKVIICMEHTWKDGRHKILENCTLPITGKNCVDLIITEKAVFEVDKEKGLTLVEVAESVGVEDVVSSTGCSFAVSPELKPMQQI